MYVVCAYYTTKPDAGDRVAELMARMAPLTLEEPGCRAYAVNRSTEDPTRFLLYEQYDDEAAFQAHLASPHLESIVKAQVWPLLADRRRELYDLVAG